MTRLYVGEIRVSTCGDVLVIMCVGRTHCLVRVISPGNVFCRVGDESAWRNDVVERFRTLEAHE